MNNGTQKLSGRSARNAVAAILTAAAIVCAPTAQADPVADDFIGTNGWRVCVELDTAPTFDGIRHVFKALAARGYSLNQSADIIVGSIRSWCMRHGPLLRSYVDTYAPKPQQQSGGRSV
ncbi:hypothetical protein [Mycobacteroides abscessus]|uniref:hypothetical protein n=1 Tax=Mycobacteroides abscessus TaxID=36809 RepID=UPI0007F96983|nr:hypothetical protein [Mycobacteroides abscessus]ANN98172.1 hypothetical protein BAB74_05010 [Mycobacteroides abscessus]